jgi:hypothetical protein
MVLKTRGAFLLKTDSASPFSARILRAQETTSDSRDM